MRSYANGTRQLSRMVLWIPRNAPFGIQDEKAQDRDDVRSGHDTRNSNTAAKMGQKNSPGIEREPGISLTLKQWVSYIFPRFSDSRGVELCHW